MEEAATMAAAEAADNDNEQDNQGWAMDRDSMVQRLSTTTICVGYPLVKNKFWWHRTLPPKNIEQDIYKYVDHEKNYNFLC